MPPLIGITTYGQDEARNFPLPRQYVDSVRRAGALAVLLPPGTTHLDDLVASLAGLVLSGGGDVDPVHSGGANHESIYGVDRERDVFEIGLTQRAIATGLPTLAICRGMQIVNVTLGGTLFEHLPDEVGEEIVHRLPPREPTEHPIRVEPTSQLAEILGKREFQAASWHHQALRSVPAKLRIVAWAPDGTIEAAEMPSHSWLFAVQWHPELTAERDPTQQRLFDAFVAAARTRRRTK